MDGCYCSQIAANTSSMANLWSSLKDQILQHKLTILIFGIIAACFWYLLATTWLKWGDLITDTSRELWVPLQLLKGKILYKDLSYEYGLFPPYFMSWLYKIFGVHINTLIGCGIAVTATMSLMLYKTARFFLDRIASGLVAVSFLFVFGFGSYNEDGTMNFILPYTFASTFYMLQLILSIYFFIKFINTAKLRFILLWVLFLYLAFLSRIELSFLSLAVFIFCGSIFIFRARLNKFYLLIFALPLFLGLATYLAFGLINHAPIGLGQTISMTLSGPFVLSKMGLDLPAENISSVFISFGFYIIIISALIVGSFLSSFFVRERTPRSFFISLLGVFSICMVFWFGSHVLTEFAQYRCLPIILIIGAAVFFVRALRRDNFKEDLSLLLLFLISLFTIAKIFFKALPFDYGFYLLVPALICYFFFFLKFLRDLLLTVFVKVRPAALNLLLAAFFLSGIIPYWNLSLKMYGLRSRKIETMRGALFQRSNEKNLAVYSLLNYLKLNTLENSTLVVLPEGASINFLANRDNPLKDYNFLPPFVRFVGDDLIISEFSRAQIDYIAIVGRDTSEYGFSFFGVDYAVKLAAWIRQNYREVGYFVAEPFTPGKFGIALFKKRQDA